MNTNSFNSVPSVGMQNQDAAAALAGIYQMLGNYTDQTSAVLAQSSRTLSTMQSNASSVADANAKETAKAVAEYLDKLPKPGTLSFVMKLVKFALTLVAAISSIVAGALTGNPMLIMMGSMMAAWSIANQMPTSFPEGKSLLDRADDAGITWLRPTLAGIMTATMIATGAYFGGAVGAVAAGAATAGTTGFSSSIAKACGAPEGWQMGLSIFDGAMALAGSVGVTLSTGLLSKAKLALGIVNGVAAVGSSAADVTVSSVQLSQVREAAEMARDIGKKKEASSQYQTELKTIGSLSQSVLDMLKDAQAIFSSQAATLQQGFRNSGQAFFELVA
jgi:hypothetical protein